MSLRERQYRVDVKAATDLSWLFFPDADVVTLVYLRIAPVFAMVDFYKRGVAFDFAMSEVLATRPVGGGLVEQETFDVLGRADTPFGGDQLDGHLVGKITWRRNQVDPPAAECESDTHAMSLRPLQ